MMKNFTKLLMILLACGIAAKTNAATNYDRMLDVTTQRNGGKATNKTKQLKKSLKQQLKTISNEIGILSGKTKKLENLVQNYKKIVTQRETLITSKSNDTKSIESLFEKIQAQVKNIEETELEIEEQTEKITQLLKNSAKDNTQTKTLSELNEKRTSLLETFKKLGEKISTQNQTIETQKAKDESLTQEMQQAIKQEADIWKKKGDKEQTKRKALKKELNTTLKNLHTTAEEAIKKHVKQNDQQKTIKTLNNKTAFNLMTYEPINSVQVALLLTALIQMRDAKEDTTEKIEKLWFNLNSALKGKLATDAGTAIEQIKKLYPNVTAK